MPSDYKKRKGGGGYQGNLYQIKLLILILVKAYQCNKTFKLSTENLDDGLFDDVVLEVDDNSIVLAQSKHNLHGNAVLKFSNLFQSTSDYSLIKYVKSFEDLNMTLYKKIIGKINNMKTVKNQEYCKFLLAVKNHLVQIEEKFQNNYNEYLDAVKELRGVLNKGQVYVIKINEVDEADVKKEIIQIIQELKKWFNHRKYIFFTNCDIDDNLKMRFVRKIDVNDIYDFNLSTYDVTCYDFNTANSLVALRERYSGQCTEAIIHHFLNELQLIVLKDNVIDKIIEDGIQPNQLNLPISLEYLQNKVTMYYNSIKGTYLKKVHFLSYLIEFWSEKIQEELRKYIGTIKYSDENILPTNQITIIKSTNHFLLMIKILEELEKEKQQKFLFVDLDISLSLHTNENLIEFFQLSEYVYIFCTLRNYNEDRMGNILQNITESGCLPQHKKIVFLAQQFNLTTWPVTDDQIFLPQYGN